MLRSIRLKNFRSLRDTGDVELRPIVLLVGANSSGKSSLLRFFPLLKQTAQANSRSPLLWFREERGLVDFRDFENTLSRAAAEPEIVVSGELEVTIDNAAREQARVRFHSHISAKDGRSYVRKFEYECFDDKTVAILDPNQHLTALTVADVDLVEGMSETKHEVVFDTLTPYFATTQIGQYAHALLQKKLWEHVHSHTGPEKLEEITWDIDYGSAGYVYQTILEACGGTKTWRDNVQMLGPSSLYIKEIKQLALLRALGGYERWNPMVQLSRSLSALAHGVRYIGPFRRAPARFYRQQEVSVDEIDATGSNLAMFLSSLNEQDRGTFSSWIYEHFGFHVRAERREAQVVLRVDTGTDSKFDLTDMGFGISQLLPVAAQCWLASQVHHPVDLNEHPALLAIEQPELHLHPRHQSQLADMFLSLANAARDAEQELTLCIETHSEAMIYRFGELVESGRLRPEDITILFFENQAGRDESTVRPIAFDENGVLQNWPIGFFRG